MMTTNPIEKTRFVFKNSFTGEIREMISGSFSASTPVNEVRKRLNIPNGGKAKKQWNLVSCYSIEVTK